MVSVPEATSIIISHLFSPRKEKVSLLRSTGRILGTEVKADRDFPPFDRATMDGIAVLSLDFQRGIREFPIAGVQVAGMGQMKISVPGNCMEVMTGAVVPEGADTVIRYEDVEMAHGKARVKLEKLTRGENIHYRGSDVTENAVLLSPGACISPAEIALMASVGMEEVEVLTSPKIAVIATGDELVAVHRKPKPYQIRLSNVFAIQSALYQAGLSCNIFHIRDEEELLKQDLRQILDGHEILILSGGASKGKRDFVPGALEAAGIGKAFYQVAQKPGKPFWFGTDKRHTVFALPGNPVSTYMCLFRYVMPWLMKSLGKESAFPTAVLARGYQFKLPLTCFLQVKIKTENGRLMAYPEPGAGSGDFANLKEVDGFLELPQGRENFLAGEVFPFIPFRNDWA